jgi:hypothetical protein
VALPRAADPNPEMPPATCTGADAAREAAAHEIAPPPAKAPPPPPGAPAATNLLGMVKSCAANVRPHLRPAMPSLEQVRASPHYPVVVTPNPSLPGDHTYNGSHDLTAHLSINGGVIEWENDLFKVWGGVWRGARGFGG